ncbi:MAG: hypothetical protein R2780_12735 [Crocinitomicaceae bacterium]
MGWGKDKTERGQGGKLGHSGRDGWEYHDEAKESSRKQRRINDKEIIREELKNMNLMDFQENWSNVVDKGFSDYKSLTREERVWFNVEPLITDGLWDHYMNYGADHNADTIEDLEFLNFNSVANQLREFNGKYFPNGVPAGPDSRDNILHKFPEEKLEEDIENLDNNFWKVCSDLEAALVKHLQSSGF